MFFNCFQGYEWNSRAFRAVYGEYHLTKHLALFYGSHKVFCKLYVFLYIDLARLIYGRPAIDVSNP